MTGLPPEMTGLSPEMEHTQVCPQSSVRVGVRYHVRELATLIPLEPPRCGLGVVLSTSIDTKSLLIRRSALSRAKTSRLDERLLRDEAALGEDRRERRLTHLLQPVAHP